MTQLSPKLEALDWYLTQSVDLSLHPYILFYGGDLISSLAKLPRERMSFYQTFFPVAHALQQQRFQVNAEPSGSPTLVLVALTKSKGANDLTLQVVARSILPDVQVVIVLETDLGGGALAKHFRRELPEVVIESKAHSKIIHCTGRELSLFLERTEATPWQEKTLPYNGTSYHTHPALFSWKEADPGSLLLLETVSSSNALQALSKRASLHLADFGCSWGLLGLEFLKQLPVVKALTFIDAERSALEVLQRTISSGDFSLPAEAFHLIWGDVTFKNFDSEFDLIVSNLPFHDPTGTNYTLQAHFLEAIYRALKPGGEGYLVWHQIPPRPDERPWFQFGEVRILQSRQPYFIVSVKK